MEEKIEESKTISLLNQILSYKGLIIGIAAVITAAASWFKPPDITATKATYEILSGKVNELTKSNEELKKSIEASKDEAAIVHAYIEGFNIGKLSSIAGNNQIIKPPTPKVSQPKTNPVSSDWDPNITPAPKQEDENSSEKIPVSTPASAPLPSFDQVINHSAAAF